MYIRLDTFFAPAGEVGGLGERLEIVWIEGCRFVRALQERVRLIPDVSSVRGASALEIVDHAHDYAASRQVSAESRPTVTVRSQAAEPHAEADHAGTDRSE